MGRVVRVVGVGSPHGDDRVGWEVVARLAAAEPKVETLVLGDPADLPLRLAGCDALVVVDACRTGAAPGTVIQRGWPAPELESPRARSTHGFGVAGALRLAETLGTLPPSVDLFAIEAGDCGAMGELGPEVSRRLDAIVEELRCVVSSRERGVDDPEREGARE